MTGRRDVEGFKHLLWQWYASQRDAEEMSLPKEVEAADQALAAVLKAFEADCSVVTLPSVTTPQNSRDSDFP